jgi:hypothetical protein
MNKYIVLRRIAPDQKKHVATGRTHHYRDNRDSNPAELRIVTYENEPGFYLLHFDSQGKELTDTLHDTIVEALEEAQWE